ncbi:MAG: helix-turn-helix transcriptional regulator [Desulfobacula sp.]|jgi:transcriptional regulator with XRE-family HTH domain|nr:helix-turn-helix transcriptional regulator [Desulfobacula sp.]
MMNLKKMIGARIQKLRKQKGLTQDELSEKVNISSKYLSSIERGKENPTLNTFISIAEELSVDIEEFFTEIQLEDPKITKEMILSLIDQADEDQLKTIYQILAVIVQ